jgi:hypothetical protein
MMRCAHYIALVSLMFLPLTAAAGPCQDVVEDTVAEIRAGASAPWTVDAESLVRAAAGSACVKALSERYSGSVADASTDKATSSTDKESAASGEAASAADGSFSLGGITVRSISGSPSKKPYERGRENNDVE